jgi:hypothetical protein
VTSNNCRTNDRMVTADNGKWNERNVRKSRSGGKRSVHSIGGELCIGPSHRWFLDFWMVILSFRWVVEVGLHNMKDESNQVVSKASLRPDRKRRKDKGEGQGLWLAERKESVPDTGETPDLA